MLGLPPKPLPRGQNPLCDHHRHHHHHHHQLWSACHAVTLSAVRATVTLTLTLHLSQPVLFVCNLGTCASMPSLYVFGENAPAYCVRLKIGLKFRRRWIIFFVCQPHSDVDLEDSNPYVCKTFASVKMYQHTELRSRKIRRYRRHYVVHKHSFRK